MPAAGPGQVEYYSSPHRRQSSQSQTNLPQQVSRPELYSPSRSAVFLPATTYDHSQPQHTRSRTPSLPKNLLPLDTSLAFSSPRDRTNNPPSSANPDDFYRQYPPSQEQNGVGTGTLHQDAIRALSPKHYAQSRAGSNGSYSTNWSIDDPQDRALPPNVPGLKSRKSSVKNLVAQLNASASAEVPPIPAQPVPNKYASQNSSSFLSSAHVSQFADVRKYSSPDRMSSGLGDGRSRGRTQTGQQRPLFGEVVPGSAPSQSPGYGIVNPKRRTGSESSPMHSPNPMFPSEQRDSQFVLSPAVYTSSEQRPDHRRATSDMATASSRPDTATSPVSNRRPPISSRIPISNRRMSAASDSGNSTPNSRAASALDKRQVNSDNRTTSHKVTGAGQPMPVPDSSTTRITSPGRRGKPLTSQQAALQQGAKSPSLRANIIAPPPKISPPLRSSRPRLPVSSATTASSRARMAEKFNAMQKLNNEKRAAQQRRGKPRELEDIDLEARRLRITQAITKSKESELRARLQTGRRSTSRATSPRPVSTFSDDTAGAPRVMIDNTDGGRQSSLFDLQTDQQYATESALHAMHGHASHYATENDSPTLGNTNNTFDKPTMRLQTHHLHAHNNANAEPMSAVTDMTADTEATHIDPEPQDDTSVDRPSLLSHVMQMRENSPAGRLEPSPIGFDDPDDRADVESVNLVFRNTAYLDDDEAISKGYRPNFSIPDPLPEEPEDRHSTRDSWTSSLHEEQDTDSGYGHTEVLHHHTAHDPHGMNKHQEIHFSRGEQHDSYRDTMASDAYTIINIVLQENSSSGIVDQQFADDVFQKVLQVCPEIEEEGSYDQGKIEQLCLQEIGRRDNVSDAHFKRTQGSSDTTDLDLENPKSQEAPASPERLHESPAENRNSDFLALPSTTYHGHRHTASLDSAEDWAVASPSVGDWMKFAVDAVTPPQERESDEISPEAQRESQVANSRDAIDETGSRDQNPDSRTVFSNVSDDDAPDAEEYGIAIIRAPSSSPPPPPKDTLPSIQQVSGTATPASANSEIPQPRVPHRMASLGQTSMVRQSHSSSREASIKSRAEVTPWETQDIPSIEVLSPEARKLKQRKHVIQELVDTEYTYQRDMRVVCDIYKPTALAALTEDDIRILFSNVEQVQQFARDFLTALKHTTKSSARGKERKDGPGPLAHNNSSNSTLASAKIDAEISDMQKDRETRIGDAFEGSLGDMETVYAEYIRNRHAANLKLESLQKSTTAQEWLKECRDNSNDITNAWNLDALLVKPVQRITKYPLLLKELIDATAEDHPDLPTLRHVMNKITDINIRINDVKKHAEMLDQAINRRRGQSDVRTGISKAFGRRAEKLRQHVGITDMYEDSEYDKLRVSFDNSHVQLVVVASDCVSYERGMSQWVNKLVEVAAAAEAWIDVGHSHHPTEESKLRHLAMIIRNVNNIALPDHIEHLQKKVIKPMTTTVDILQRFRDDPKGLLQKRDKRLVDYAQMKNKKDRGEKVDKKTAERMDQWEALNTEAKDRMKKLLRATAHLVQTCQGHLVQLQMSWMAMIQQKFASVMGININRLSVDDIERDWQEAFDFQEASALALCICNGSLMLQAANMTSFLTPSTTLNGEDSPRQMSMSSSNNKRSISLHSESSNVPTLDFASRPSGSYSNHALPDHFDRPYPYPNGRNRAASTTSGTSIQRPEASGRPATHTKHASASANFGRPGTSPIMQQDLFAPPRLSVETHSPLMSSFPPHTMAVPERPVSAQTFHSAVAGPSQAQIGERLRGSGVFSSAMPLSDSPAMERQLSDVGFGDPKVLFTAASVYEFNIDRARREAGFPYLTYVTGEIFDVIGERGELWLAKNQDDPNKQIGWIWNKHFAKLAE